LGSVAEATDGKSPLTRLAEIQARIEQLREETNSLTGRARTTVETVRSSHDRAVARARVEAMQRDLDAAVEQIEGLRTAMQTRGVIEQAKGMIMAAIKVDEEAAFQVLVARSQKSHKKLVEIARDVVDAGVQPA
jgi:phage terminase small subunit